VVLCLAAAIHADNWTCYVVVFGGGWLLIADVRIAICVDCMIGLNQVNVAIIIIQWMTAGQYWVSRESVAVLLGSGPAGKRLAWIEAADVLVAFIRPGYSWMGGGTWSIFYYWRFETFVHVLMYVILAYIAVIVCSHFTIIALYYRCIVRFWAFTTVLDSVVLHSCTVSLCIVFLWYFWFVCHVCAVVMPSWVISIT